MPRPCTPDAAAQLQPTHALRLAYGAQRALLPVAVGAMNIHDVRDRQTDNTETSDADHRYANAPPGRGHNKYLTIQYLRIVLAAATKKLKSLFKMTVSI